MEDFLKPDFSNRGSNQENTDQQGFESDDEGGNTPVKTRTNYSSSSSTFLRKSEKEEKEFLSDFKSCSTRISQRIAEINRDKKFQFEIVTSDIPLDGKITERIRDDLLEQNQEFFFTLTDNAGTPVEFDDFDPIPGGQKEHEASNLDRSFLTGHTHPSERKLNPPSSHDIHAVIQSIAKLPIEVTDDDQFFVLSHCVFLPTKIYVFTIDPLLLTLSRAEIDYDLAECFAALDWLCSDNPSISEADYIEMASRLGISIAIFPYDAETIQISILKLTNVKTLTSSPTSVFSRLGTDKLFQDLPRKEKQSDEDFLTSR